MKKKTIIINLLTGFAVVSALASCGTKKPTSTSTDPVTSVPTSTPVTEPVTSVPTSTPTIVPTSTIKVTVVYDLDGGVLTGDLTTEVTKGAEYNLLTVSPTKSGYRFLGWSLNDDTTIYSTGATVTINDNTTIKANWVQQVTVTIDANFVGGNRVSTKCDAGSDYTVPECPFTRENYSLVGYATSSVGTLEYEVDDVIELETSNIILYALWVGNDVSIELECKNTIYFDYSTTVKSYQGGEIELPSYDLESFGYSFAGWSVEPFSSTSPTNFTVKYLPGETVKINDLELVDNKIKLYGCYYNSGSHSYVNSSIFKAPTLEEDGIYRNMCSKTGHDDYYDEILSKNDIFATYIENVFTINGRGTVAATKILQGSVNVNDEIRVVRVDGTYFDVIISGIEIDRKVVDKASSGDNAALLLHGIDKDAVSSGDLIVAKNKEIKTQNIRVKTHIFTKDEGGRHTPFFINYAPDMIIGTNNFKVKITKIYDTDMNELEMALPGDDYILDIVVNDDTKYLLAWVGQSYPIREGGVTIGYAEIIERLDAE